MFTFVVIWNEIGSGTRSNVTTSSSPYTISGLHPGTSYQISVLVMGESGVISRMTLHNVATLGEWNLTMECVRTYLYYVLYKPSFVYYVHCSMHCGCVWSVDEEVVYTPVSSSICL